MRPAGQQQPHSPESPAAAEVIDLTAASSSSSASAAGPDADAAQQCLAASPSTQLPQLARPPARLPLCAAQEDHVAAAAARVPQADSRAAGAEVQAFATAMEHVAADASAQPQQGRQIATTHADAALEGSLAGPCPLQPPGQVTEATDFPVGRPKPAGSMKAAHPGATEPVAVPEHAGVAEPAASQVAPAAAAAASSTAESAGGAEAEAPGKHVQPAALVAVGKRLVKKVSSWRAVMNSSVA